MDTFSDIMDGDYKYDIMAGGGCGNDDLFYTENFLPFLKGGRQNNGVGRDYDDDYSQDEILQNILRLSYNPKQRGGTYPAGTKAEKYDLPEGTCTGFMRYMINQNYYLYFLTDKSVTITPKQLNFGEWTVHGSKVMIAPFTTSPKDASVWVQGNPDRRVYSWVVKDVKDLIALPGVFHAELTQADNRQSNGKLKNRSLVQFIEGKKDAEPGCQINGATFKYAFGEEYHVLLDMNVYSDNTKIEYVGSIDYPTGGQLPIGGKIPKELAVQFSGIDIAYIHGVNLGYMGTLPPPPQQQTYNSSSTSNPLDDQSIDQSNDQSNNKLGGSRKHTPFRNLFN